ncbi:MAG: insulinase family protein, partial [Candidatus Zixiibacteriota bacterium]
YDKQIAQAVAAFQASREIGSHFQIQATAKPGVSLEELEREIDDILNDVMTNGITPEEFELARTNWESGFIRRLDNISGFGGMADMMNAYNIFLGGPDMFNWDKARYEKATIDDMLAYMRTYMQPDKRAILSVYPKSQLTASELAVDMAVNPAGEEKPSFTPPTIQTATLSNGMELYLVEDHDLPLVECDLIIKSGYDCDPADRPGAASLTSELLNEGTKTRNALEISDAFRALGADFGVGSGWDNTFVNLNVLKKNLDAALDLTADVVVNPTFPQEELDRQKEIYLGRIKQEAMQPFTICYKAFSRELYGAAHPYGQPYTGSGTEESISAISRSDLQDYFNNYYRPNNTTAVVVGDITLDEAKSRLEKAFKNWKKSEIPETMLKRAASLDKTKVVIIDKPGATQSVIFAGNLIENRNDPEYVPSTVITNILGGGSTGRLFLNLRQDKGYTYGAYSFFSSRKGQGSFACYSQVQGDKTVESLTEFMKEIRGICGEIPLTEKELTDSRNNYANGYPREFQTIGGIAGQLGTLVSYDLPMDYWSTYIDKINGVDMKKANELAQKKIHPDALLIVVVGDREKIESGIRALNLGEIVIASAN